MILKQTENAASYRDPSGFVFTSNGRLYRQINFSYQANFDLLLSSGLYNKLTANHLLISHKEIAPAKKLPAVYKIIEPRLIPFISFAYEWSFSQLQDAALLTLQTQKIALEYGLSLKDATSFNIQFLDGKPILIDTLSFEKYEEGKPWVAYKQFCEQFLAPLTLMSTRDISFGKMLQDGAGNLPISLASDLLPLKGKLNPALFMHIFLHGQAAKKSSEEKINTRKTGFSQASLQGLITSLENAVLHLSWQPKKTVWANYYEEKDRPSYNNRALSEKKKLVSEYLAKIKPKTAWDLGANTGIFSRLAAQQKIFTVSLDNDPSVVELNYRQVKKDQEKNLLPLWVDITNPTPSIGWANKEWPGFLNRPLPDVVLALALIHHLAIGKNLPLSKLAEFFAKLTPALIIEFVPKEDPQTKRLLANREDIFPNYTLAAFEENFKKFFTIKESQKLTGSLRVLYLMERKRK